MIEAMTRYVLGAKYTGWLELQDHPMLDIGISWGWPTYVAVREGTLPLPLATDFYWTIDEFMRQGVLFYLNSGQSIDITIPDGNRTGF